MVISVGALAALDSVVKFAANEGLHPIQIVFFLGLTITINSIFAALLYWEWPPYEFWLWLVVHGVGGSFGHMI